MSKNYKNSKEIHIGSIIKQKLDTQGISASDFAKAICCNRPNVYSIFKRKSIDIEQLRSISKALNYDFIAEYYEDEDSSKKKILLIVEIPNAKLPEVESDPFIKIIHRFEASK